MIGHRFFLLLGPALYSISCFSMSFVDSPTAIYSVGVISWMLTWWLSEVIPMAVTALLPIILFSMGGIMSIDECLISYSDKFVFLFLAGFLMALAIEKWGLHHFFARWILSKTGENPKACLAGLMFTTYFTSMWISNTATAIMMLPLALAMTQNKSGHVPPSIKKVTVLGIAYSASIGGMATLLGSPPNAAMAGILLREYGVQVSFWEWFKWGFPFSIILLIAGYFVLISFVSKKDWAQWIIIPNHERTTLNFSQKKVLGLFLTTALLWIFQSPISAYLGVWFNDTFIGLSAAILFFVSFKNQPILVWEDTKTMPWGILLMFGGGLCLANGFKAGGILDWITRVFQGNHEVTISFLIIIAASGLLLTALMSNLAMVALFIPIVGQIAIQMQVSPLLLALPVTLASSCDFMFPMSTPPNAIAYSSGHVNAGQMFRIGFVLNLCAFVLLIIWMLWML